MSNKKQATANTKPTKHKQTKQTGQTGTATKTKSKESGEPKECRACPDCTHAKENKKPCKRLKWKYSMKIWVFALIAFACLGGIIAPFIAQYLAPRKSALEVALSAWNQYVSIILGIVATLLSIVSLVFSFHNEEEENIQQRNYSDKFDDINRTLQKIEDSVDATKEKVNHMSDKMAQIDTTVSIIKANQSNGTVKSTPPNTTVDPNNVGN